MLTRYPQLVAGTNYSELAGSPRITCDERGLNGSRTFKVHGDVLAKFLAGAKGSPYLEDAPEALPGFPTILCVSVDAEPFPGAKGLPSAFTAGVPNDKGKMTSEWWKVTCRFETPSGIAYDFSSEALTLPTAGIGWNDDPTPIDGLSIVTTVPSAELQIIRKNQPQLVPKKIMRMIGMTNAAEFNPLQVDLDWRHRVGLGNVQIYTPQALQDATIADGCALFIGASSTPIVDPLGTMSWDTVYKFSVRPDYAPWNYFFRITKAGNGRAPGGGWEHLYIKERSGDIERSTEFQPYPPANFAELFT